MGLSLDVGCGFDKSRHKKKGDIGLDLYRGICDILGDMQHLPFRSDIFEKVLLYAVLEHLDNPLKGLEEAQRVAKNGARFEITIPVEARFYICNLHHLILEFPMGLIIPLDRMWRSLIWGWRKKRGTYHKNRIQPDHIARYLKIEKVEMRGGIHYWFRGRKGTLFRRIFTNPAKLGTERTWYIEAVKARALQN